MNKVAKFEKVSYNQFKKDLLGLFNEVIIPDDTIKSIYDNISLPTRSTATSAGYDFKIPFSINLEKGANLVIPTGIRCKFIDMNYSLDLYPKSGLGFKYKTELANTIGIVDSDYYNADNEGHIMIKIINTGFDDSIIFTEIKDNDLSIKVSKSVLRTNLTPDDNLVLKANNKFVQGKFIPFGITEDDEAEGKRIGGFGSTGK